MGYGDWKASRGHIAGKGHRLWHLPRALCIAETGKKAFESSLAVLTDKWQPSVRVAMLSCLCCLADFLPAGFRVAEDRYYDRNYLTGPERYMVMNLMKL